MPRAQTQSKACIQKATYFKHWNYILSRASLVLSLNLPRLSVPATMLRQILSYRWRGQRSPFEPHHVKDLHIASEKLVTSTGAVHGAHFCSPGPFHLN